MEEIIFYRIARTVDLHIGQSGDSFQSIQLNLHRQRRGETVEVKLLSILTLRFKEKLMLRLVGESHDFGLDGGAISRTDALNLSVVERRVGQPAAEHLMGGFGSVNRIAHALRQLAMHRREIGKMMAVVLQFLREGELPVHRTAVDTHRCAGLHTVSCHAESTQLFGHTI